jgi:hypothetical protein
MHRRTSRVQTVKRPTAGRETPRRTSRVQTARDLQQAEKGKEGPAEYRQSEIYSRQKNAQKGRQSTDNQRPTAGREKYRRASRPQAGRDLQQAENRTEGLADNRQPETCRKAEKRTEGPADHRQAERPTVDKESHRQSENHR